MQSFYKVATTVTSHTGTPASVTTNPTLFSFIKQVLENTFRPDSKIINLVSVAPEPY